MEVVADHAEGHVLILARTHAKALAKEDAVIVALAQVAIRESIYEFKKTNLAVRHSEEHHVYRY